MRYTRGLNSVLLLGVGLGLAACTSDGLDAAGWVSGPAIPPQQIATAGVDVDTETMPSLGSVPPRPRPSPQAEREQRVVRLSGDLAAAAYTGTPPPDPRPGAAPPLEVVQDAPATVRPAPPKISREPQPPGPAPLLPLPATVPVQSVAAKPLPPRAPPIAAPTGAGRLESQTDTKAAGGELVALFYFPALVREVAPDDRPLLKQLAQLQQQRRGQLRIVGHAAAEADVPLPQGGMLADLRISLSRASAVAAALAKLGVPAESLIVAGVGRAQPRYDSATPAGLAANRRVEIFLE